MPPMQRLRDAAGRIARPGIVLAHRVRPGTFTFAGVEYRYFAHPYNETWRNERAVELPIVLRALDERPGARVLEVGNVLAHYGRGGHEVIDKYEAAPGVRAVDVAELDPADKYDLIVTISTLEHVGLDEDVRDPAKPRRAVERMVSALAPGGMLLVTVPLAYNENLDRDLREGLIGFDQVGFLKRVSASNRWAEVPAAEAAEIAYGTPYQYANGLAVGTLRAG
jgi:SAM-dependent methyltransferase